AAKGDWGISKQEYYRDNLQATETLLEAAKQSQIKKWFFYSTVSVLGPSKIPLAEESPRRPINAYGASKTECEELFEQYFAQEPGVNIVIVRPSVVFGPGNPWNTNIFRLIDTIYRRRFIMIGNGEDVKTTSYIENLIEAHMFLMHRQMNNNQSGVEIFHYVDEPQEKTHEIIEAIYQNLDRKYSRLRLPLWFASPIARISDVLASILNIDFPITSARIEKFCTPTNFSSQAIRKLGFVQKVSNDQAIKETIDSYIREHSV
ncbi:MAG: NAD(P)-dependent oxidoreductase, partial [Gammaproteobacteria bacterium]|nr:NAD(P)-dependent oxidoreductase [Gammaproteobacteria bacterium]